MLISRMSEGEGRDTGEYRAADELFELMAKDHSYDTSDNQSLSTRDLIILYKNIDVGTKLISDANVERRKTPNQHVETVVYKDERESDDSDGSEIYSNEDLQEVFSINNERIDLINNLSSLQHPLCHKFGDVELQSSNLTSEYERQFLFKDPYIKQQLKNINILPDSTEFDSILSASLLDYICCKRLEDNYNFYMDNVIKYVQHTIEQLKRISNGEYLTDRAKEKWREVENVIPRTDDTNVLATSVSIPIHVMGKVDAHKSTWDDIVHSEVDVRSLSKILEKKIVIEVPKLICGSYRLFSERCADNLIISCKQDLDHDIDRDKSESRLDVVFQLEPSGSGHVISKINSIMILQKMPSIAIPELNVDEEEIVHENCKESFEERPKIVEIVEIQDIEEHQPMLNNSNIKSNALEVAIEKDSACSLSNNSNADDKRLLKRKVSIKTLKTETECTVMSPDQLRCAIRRLNMQTPVPEESEESSISKKKSPTRVRIKSPYENKSYSLEEKKRKKLLEIRDKREKKKMAISENCKISKHKYGKTTVMAQPSNSVTKLSITNKSFYNSIYGESVNYEGDISKKTRKSQKKDVFQQDLRKDVCESEFNKFSHSALDSSFDDGATETVIQMQQKLDTQTYPTPDSDKSNYSTDVNLLSQLMGTYIDCSSDDDSSLIPETKRDEDNTQEIHEGDNDMADLGTSLSGCILVPVNSPKEKDPNPQNEVKKTTISVECRKSIDKIYDLLKKLGKHDENEITNPATQDVSNNTDELNVDTHRSSTVQASDSGTSLKHHIISSNPSTFSFEKNNNLCKQRYQNKKKKETPATVVPKVIISTKLQTSKTDSEWNRTDRKRVTTSASPKVSDNPLKAISQLLHEFNNVQKTRHKTIKKDDPILTDGKIASRQGSSKKPRQDHSSKDCGLTPLKSLAYRERKSRPGQPTDPAQFYHHLTYGEDKQAGKSARRNLSDIIDEAKEARGEAVRGPPKQTRLNTLAQPKKSYVQAHNDEYQNKYGRNITANRLQRATISTSLVEKNNVNANNVKNKRKGPETLSVIPLKPAITSVPPLERITRPRRSASNSPARKRVPQSTNEPPFRQISAPKSPDLKKKMVAVESYVKNHYGRVPIDTSELKGNEVHKSRVPLIPNDIDLESVSSPVAEESTALGNQLHYMVDTMINTNAPALSVLTELQESTSKLSDGLEKLSTESLLKIDERKSESDYPVDIFGDKNILTAVASIPKDKIHEDKVVDGNIDNGDNYDIQPFNSATELRKLENALYQQMSVGAFPKRLRIKNLTLTPKQSLQQVIVVQSGDAGSLLVKSSLSQSLKSDSKTDSLTALKPLAALSNTHINWGFTNIPLQVATIGYAFPTFQSTERHSLSPYVKTLMERHSNENVNTNACKSHKTSQCFKGVHTECAVEQATQANFVVSITSTNINMKTSATQKEKITKQSEKTQNSENIQPITEICERIRPIIKKWETPITEEYKILQPITEKCERERPIKIESQILQPMTGKCNELQTVAEKCNKVQTLTGKFETGQLITQQCESIQPLTGQLKTVQSITQHFEKLQPITDQSERLQQMTDQFERVQPITDQFERVQSMTDQFERPKPTTEKFERVQQTADQFDRVQPVTEQWETAKDYQHLSKMSLNIDKDINEGESVRKPSETIDHSTSLDILMGLLNEIRKITGEAINKNTDDEHEQNTQCKELEIILNNAVTHESSVENNCRDIVSVSSFDKLHQLDSIPSLCSFNSFRERHRVLINNENKHIIKIGNDFPDESQKPKNVDKDVTVDIEKQYVNKLTDTPSCFFPLTLNHSTNISDSVIEDLSERSTPSVYSFAKYETLKCNSSLDVTLEQSYAKNSKVLTSLNNALKAEYFHILDDKEDEKILSEKSANVKVEAMAIVSSYRCASKIVTGSKCVTIGSTFDPLMKVKRDILVTVYSILVFTVFAALTFPKVFFDMDM